MSVAKTRQILRNGKRAQHLEERIDHGNEQLRQRIESLQTDIVSLREALKKTNEKNRELTVKNQLQAEELEREEKKNNQLRRLVEALQDGLTTNATGPQAQQAISNMLRLIESKINLRARTIGDIAYNTVGPVRGRGFFFDEIVIAAETLSAELIRGETLGSILKRLEGKEYKFHSTNNCQRELILKLQEMITEMPPEETQAKAMEEAEA